MSTLTDNSDLDGAKQVVKRAVEKYQTDRAALFAFDGKTPINPPDVHQRQLDKAIESVQWATDKAVAVAAQVAAEVESQRLAPHADPTGSLSAAELQDANLRAQWIREDCETLPLADLVERLRAVHASGSKSSTWLHDRYAKARWKVESDKTPQDAALSMFAETLRDLGVTGPKAGLSSEAVKRQESAAALSRWAQGQLRIARDPAKDAADRRKSAEHTRAMF